MSLAFGHILLAVNGEGSKITQAVGLDILLRVNTEES